MSLAVFIRSFKNHIYLLTRHCFFLGGGIYPKEVIKYVHKGMSIRIFIAPFLEWGKIGNVCILKAIQWNTIVTKKDNVEFFLLT